MSQESLSPSLITPTRNLPHRSLEPSLLANDVTSHVDSCPAGASDLRLPGT